MYVLIITLILLGAAVFDIRTTKIPNVYQFLSLIIIFIIGATGLGDHKLTTMMLNGLIVFVPLIIIWALTTIISFKVIGAGDVKLFTVLAFAMADKDVWFVIVLSIMLTGVFGLFKVSFKRLRETSKEMLNFIVYGIPGKNEEQTVKIPVGPMVLLAYLIYLSPLYEIFLNYWEV